MDIISILVGFVIGIIMTWGSQRLIFRQTLSENDVNEKYVHKELYEELKEHYEQVQNELEVKDNNMKALSSGLSDKETNLNDLQLRYNNYKANAANFEKTIEEKDNTIHQMNKDVVAVQELLNKFIANYTGR
jgi:chromosome segregation ATPase